MKERHVEKKTYVMLCYGHIFCCSENITEIEKLLKCFQMVQCFVLFFIFV